MKKRLLSIFVVLLGVVTCVSFTGCGEKLSPQDIVDPASYLDYVRTLDEGVLYVEPYYAWAIDGNIMYVEERDKHIITEYDQGAELYAYSGWSEEWRYDYNPDITKREFNQVKRTMRREIREKIKPIRNIAPEYTLRDGVWVASNGMSRFVLDGTKLVLEALDEKTGKYLTMATIIYDYHIDLPRGAQTARRDWMEEHK